MILVPSNFFHCQLKKVRTLAGKMIFSVPLIFSQFCFDNERYTVVLADFWNIESHQNKIGENLSGNKNRKDR